MNTACTTQPMPTMAEMLELKGKLTAPADGCDIIVLCRRPYEQVKDMAQPADSRVPATRMWMNYLDGIPIHVKETNDDVMDFAEELRKSGRRVGVVLDVDEL